LIIKSDFSLHILLMNSANFAEIFITSYFIFLYKFFICKLFDI